jgi:hypothetical protein
MTNRLNISPDLSLPLEAVTSRAETPATYPLDPMPARRRA